MNFPLLSELLTGECVGQPHRKFHVKQSITLYTNVAFLTRVHLHPPTRPQSTLKHCVTSLHSHAKKTCGFAQSISHGTLSLSPHSKQPHQCPPWH